MPRKQTAATVKRKDLIYAWAQEHKPVTVRQLYYRLSTLDAVPKTEAGYKAVGRLCTLMRKRGEIPYEYFADSTRWQRKPRTFNNMQDALNDTATHYRRALWQEQQGVVEIWIEKEALVGVIFEVTSEWDVGLMPVKGYPSQTYLHAAGKSINAATSAGKKSHIFYFGDYDPSGVDIFRNIAEQLKIFAPDADLEISRVAVTEAQIRYLQLPSRPTKRSDSRAKGFSDISVELDAIEPSVFRDMVRNCIFSIIDRRTLEETLKIEKLEQESINMFVSNFKDVDIESNSFQAAHNAPTDRYHTRKEIESCINKYARINLGLNEDDIDIFVKQILKHM